MLRLMLLTAIFHISSLLAVNAQDYSNRGLMEIKEHSETARMEWIKAFDEAVQSKNFANLATLRQANEQYLDQHLSAIRRLYAEGDARALLTAVNNYLRIESQFVKDVMITAESLTGNSQEGINKIYQKITDFGQKEKMFLIDINNALLTEPVNAGPPTSVDSEMNTEEEYEEPRGSVIEERKLKRKSKLPHEKKDNGKNRKNDRDEDEDE